MAFKAIIHVILPLLTLVIFSCEKNDKIVATINNTKIYQEQIDKLIEDEVNKLRKQALKSYISNELINIEAARRNIVPDELREIEIIQKSKTVSENDIIAYARNNNFDLNDSMNYLSIKGQLTNINRRFRFEVFIDSLKKVNNVELEYVPTTTQLKNIDKIHSHFIGNKESKLHVYFIADYDCPSCINNYERVLKICKPYFDKLQFHFVYFSDHISEKALIAESIGNQDKFWDFNKNLFDIHSLSDSILEYIIDSLSIDSMQFYTDYQNKINLDKLESNKTIIENLNIYSVPTIIIGDEIFSGYTSSNDLMQIINYKLINN